MAVRNLRMLRVGIFRPSYGQGRRHQARFGPDDPARFESSRAVGSPVDRLSGRFQTLIVTLSRTTLTFLISLVVVGVQGES